MAQTYADIEQQIEKLKRKAEALRAAEVAEVVEKIKVAIAHYALTAEQLGFGGKSLRKARSVVSKRSGDSPAPKYSDGAGNAWSGRGPRPRWIKTALAAGRSLAEFEVSAKPSAALSDIAPAPSPAAKGGRRIKFEKPPSAIRYRDDAGHAWGGRGPKPAWLKAALAAGKSLGDFTAQ